jgi:hypothetical protein
MRPVGTAGDASELRRRARVGGRILTGAVVILLALSACGGGSDTPASGASSKSNGNAASSTTSSAATVTRSNCDLATELEVETAFTTAVTAAVQPETGICSYSAADAASGGLTVDLSATSPRGKARCQALERAYTSIPVSANQVLPPGQTWTTPELVKNLGGDDGFVAHDLGGQFTWAAVKGDTCVVVGVGGSTWLGGPDAQNINADVYSIMKTAIDNATKSTG